MCENPNKEPMNLMKSGTEPETGASGRTRAETLGYPGASGREGSKSPGSAHLNERKTAFARLGPPSPTLIFFAAQTQPNFEQGNDRQGNGQAELGTNMRRGETTETQRHGGKPTKQSEARGASADLCGKSYGLLRVVTRKCAKVRTDQARKSAIVRIYTGGSLFSWEGGTKP
jgi:hypothetical protein